MSESAEEARLVDPLEGFLGYQLRRHSAAAMADLANALSVQNISPALASVLLMIDANPGETQARIGRALSIQRANIAPMIARLEEDGFICRTSANGRSIGLASTPRGKVAATQIVAVMKGHEARVFGALSPDHYQYLCRLLKASREGAPFEEQTPGFQPSAEPEP